MCDEIKVGCIRSSTVPKAPNNDWLNSIMKRTNHLSTIRATASDNNEYTPMPTANILNMEQPSTSTSCLPQYVEPKRKPGSTNSATLPFKQALDDGSKCGKQSSNDVSVVKALPVIPPLLRSRSKIDLSRRVGGSSPDGERQLGRMRSLSTGSLSLERPRKYFHNNLHKSFGDADTSRFTARDHDLNTAAIIVCPKCHRCRCIQCARPHHLPSQWICGDKCLLSSGCVVDSLSCMCCIKAIRYHCRCFEACFTFYQNSSPKFDEKMAWRRRKMTDIMCVLVASMCLPCLCCYLPLKGCEACIEAIYCAWNDRSCHCDERIRRTPPTVITEQPKSATAGRLQKQRITH